MLKLVFLFFIFIAFQGFIKCDSEIPESPTIVDDLGKSREGSRTDEELVQREEERIKLDGLSVAEIKALKERSENFHYQADVTRMMKIIINSLYQNKEIFLRELISNASDALDKIRLLSLTNPEILGQFGELDIKIKADKENNILQITDTGIGMTKKDLVQNLGTLAKSGTGEFMKEMAKGERPATDLIGQFGVGFYSTFLVADKVVVVSKHNDDDQYIWESDAENFSVVKDPRGDTLKRGTQINLHLKEEANDFLEDNTLKTLIRKYSQFINFNIYLWEKSVKKIEEPIEDNTVEKKKTEDDDDEAKVEEEKDIKTNTVEKTVWDWTLMNGAKPIWTRKPSEVDDLEYKEFYKTITKESEDPLAHIHFTAEGEVTFKSILYIPKTANTNMFSEYGKKVDHIKLYVRRVFITSDFEDMMPKYLAFVFGMVDSDDLPLNVSRETLQQNKLLKVIKKKLIRKVLDMIKKLSESDFKLFWKEYSTNIKLGIVEDASNRNRLAKLVRFYSSFNETEPVSLSSYIERMKDKQESIYFVAGQSIQEVKNSPFVEKLLKKGYEVLYLTEPIDEYCIQALPEFEGKKFQNVAKEGLKLDEGKKAKARQEQLEKKFKPLVDWLKDKALPNLIEKATISQLLAKSPCALVASSYGWSGNMERLMTSSAYAKSGDPMHQHYANMKKTMEVNPGHPIIKELYERVKANPEDETAKDMAISLFGVATMRSGFALTDTKDFAERVEKLMRKGFDIPDNAEVEEELEEFEEEEEEAEEDDGGEGEEEESAEDEGIKPGQARPKDDDDSREDLKDEL